MRFWLREVDALKSYIDNHGLGMFLVDLWGTTVKQGTMDDLDLFFARSRDVTRLSDAVEYIVVSEHELTQVNDIKDEVKVVEGGSDPHHFVLQEYADGGVICFANRTLPFLAGARTAEWWTLEDMELTNSRTRPWRFGPRRWWLPRFLRK